MLNASEADDVGIFYPFTCYSGPASTLLEVIVLALIEV
jgi:hypothetical protein